MFHQQIHINIRSTLAHIRQSRIAPSAIDAPTPNFVPRPSGVGTPVPGSQEPARNGDAETKRGLQEERVNRDAWAGILDALSRLKEAREEERRRVAATDTA